MIRFRTLGTLDLRDALGREIRPLLAQPKHIALLTYLALMTPRGFHRRDRLLALFWPDLDQARARAALSLAVHRLRASLGAATVVSRGNEEIGIDWQHFWCDAAEFNRRLDDGDVTGALELYGGDLLPGFHISKGSPELERWIDDQRPRLRRRAADAEWSLADLAEAAGDRADAMRLARSAVSRNPEDERAVRRLIQLLDRMGDRAGAVREYEEFERRLADDFELSPDTETRRVLTTLRHRPSTTLPVAPELAQSEQRSVVAAVEPLRRHRRVGRAWLVGAAIAVVAGALGGAAWLDGAASRDTPLLVVGKIDASGLPDSNASFAFLLTTSLGRVAALHIVSEGRIEEVRSYLTHGEDLQSDSRRVAREVGASEILEGVLARRPSGTLRLDLRRVDLRTGAVRAAYALESRDLYDLVDESTERVAADFGARVSASRESGTTRSLVAYRMYEKGLRAYYAADREGARRFFEAALNDDSTFAMAALYLSRFFSGEEQWRVLQQASRAADVGPERERLLIHTEWAMLMQEPRSMVLAESLVARYPQEPDGHLLLGRVLIARGDFMAAVPHLRRTIDMDSLSLLGPTARCRACDAFAWLRSAYTSADSFPAAERLAREWLRKQPSSDEAWVAVASALEAQERFSEAIDMLRSPPHPKLVEAWHFSGVWIRAGNFSAVDRAWAERIENGTADDRGGALWGQTISFRTQGRLREALVAARRYRAVSRSSPGDPTGYLANGVLEGVVLFEMGRYRAAGALFDSIATLAAAPSAARNARHRVWQLTHAATAYAAAGDTARCHMLEDTIRVYGAQSSYGRDQRLHHYVRALRLRAAGRPDEAVEAFRQAMYSPVEGYVRIPLELARTLISLDRAADAIPLLDAALRGPISASGMYATRTELQELLAKAYDRVGRPDRAVANYTRVLAAWRRPDPEFLARREFADRRVAAPHGVMK